VISPLLPGPSTEKRSLSVDSVFLSDQEQGQEKRQKTTDFSLVDLGEDDDDEESNGSPLSHIDSYYHLLSSGRAKGDYGAQARTAPVLTHPPTGLSIAKMNVWLALQGEMRGEQLHHPATGATVRASVPSKYGALDPHA
jgi:hypothetical protein